MKKISGGFTDYITVDWVEAEAAVAADRDDISHLFGSIEIYAFLNQIRLKLYRVIPKKIDTIMHNWIVSLCSFCIPSMCKSLVEKKCSAFFLYCSFLLKSCSKPVNHNSLRN